MSKRNGKITTVRVSLRTVAERAGVAPCTVSAVLNKSEASWAIPQLTKNRILQVVRDLNYHPNPAARWLRTNRTYTVAVIAADLGEPHVARTIAGAEFFLQQSNYMLFLIICRGESLADIENRLLQRGVEGILSIDVNLRTWKLPAIALNYKQREVHNAFSAPVRHWLEGQRRSAASALVEKIEKAKRRAATGRDSRGIPPASDVGPAQHPAYAGV